jgi:simple sugar transport system ATP-binding protein
MTTAGPPAVAPAIALRGINKQFGPVRANRDVSLTVPAGTIHGIVGENGAGKSTLMSILYGFYQADSGEIEVAGEARKIHGPEDALAVGIGMVHQHFMLVDVFTVLENILLGAEGGPLLAGGMAAARAEVTRLETEYGLEVDPDAIAGGLAVGLRQRVELLKALYRGANILILDEPTGVLTPQEADRLFDILRAMRARGVTVILITHKLQEIMAITDNVSVMRAGQMVAHRRTAETTREELAELMVGRQVLLRVDKSRAQPGVTALRAEALSLTDGTGVKRLDGVSFDLRAGEIVGIAGVSGNGQSELLEVLSGIRPPSQGNLTVHGRVIDREHPADAAELRAIGLAHVPEDRQRMGMIPAFAAWETAILGYHQDPAYSGPVLLKSADIVADTESKMARFDVRPPDPQLTSESFSGGNQQKLVLAREIERHPDILLVGQPTRGVDIGAIEFIHRQLIEMRDRGCAVLLVSVELEEILSLSDRILVMFEGRIVGEVDGAEADARTIGLMMANALDAEAVHG